MEIIVNPDKDFANNLRKEIKDNNGYCPHQIKSENSKCICVNFLESAEAGDWCICGLYQKIKK